MPRAGACTAARVTLSTTDRDLTRAAPARAAGQGGEKEKTPEHEKKNILRK